MGERYFVECRSPVSAINCATLAALLHERARVSFGLPCAGEPVTHAMALRLQCGGLSGLRQSLGATDTNVHALIGAAHERHASLTALPWQEILLAITCWQPKRRSARPP